MQHQLFFSEVRVFVVHFSKRKQTCMKEWSQLSLNKFNYFCVLICLRIIMGGHGKPVCFVCLKLISQNHNGRHKSRRKDGDVKDSELFRKFTGVLSSYLQLSSLSPAGGTTAECENVPFFCDQCVSMITNACDVYKELQAVERRLSKQLGELGELMMGKMKLSEGLSKSLTEQLTKLEVKVNGKLGGFVEKVRNVVAMKCALKGREMELLEHVLEKGTTEDVEEGYQEDVEHHYIKLEMESDADYSPLEGGDSDDADFEKSLLNEKDAVQGRKKPVRGDNKDENSERFLSSSSSHSSDSESSSAGKFHKKKKRKKTIHPSQEAAVGGKLMKLDGGVKVKARQKLDIYVECNCTLCGMPFENMALFGRHLLTHENKEPLKNIACNFCWMSFALPETYLYHLTTELQFSCDHGQCEELSFGSTHELNEHLQTHAESVHICSTCNWGFLSRHMLELHMLIHLRSVRGNFPCPKCPSTLHGFSKFRDHYNIRHGASMALYKCPTCSVSCVTMSKLQTHLKAHGNQSKAKPSLYPPISCEKCEMTFKGDKRGKERLRGHMKTMHSEVKHPCHVCSETFISERSMERHMKSEHQTTKMRCEFCNKESASRTALKTHISKMHPSNPEEKQLCEHCASVFSNRSYLLQHIRVVHKELFENSGKNICSTCGRKFHMLGLLKKHAKTCESRPVGGVENDNTGDNELDLAQD